MGLSADFILNHNASDHQHNSAVNGITKRLEFVSGGYCQFDEAPEGCIIFSLEKSLPRPSLKRRIDSSSPQTLPKKISTESVSLQPPPKKLCTESIGPQVVQKKAYVDSTEKREDISPQRKPLTNGVVKHVDTPRPPQKRASVNGFNQDEEDRTLIFNWQGLDIGRVAKHGSGLTNSRNDCFMNSVLQFVFHTPQLLRYVLSRKKHNCLDKDRCMSCILNSYYTFICMNKSTFTAVRLREIVNSQFPNRIPNNQEDAHEMLIFLLSKLEPPLPKRNGSSAEPRPKAPPTEIDKIFGGKLRYRIKCRECSHTQGSSEQFRELNLNLPSPSNQIQASHLESFIESYFKCEYLNDYKCDRCGEKNSIRMPCIESPPNILVVQLKRFRYNGGKNHAEVILPLDLDLSNYALKREQSLQYKLYGFISHSGMSANSGHYKATMLGYDKKWYQFDDDYVCGADPNRFDQRQPYLLFYYRVPAISRPTHSTGIFTLHNPSSSKQQNHQWNTSSSSIKRPLVDKQNTQNGNSQRNGYQQSNGSSYQSVFKKSNTNGYHTNGDSQKWNSHNTSNGHHSMNGDRAHNSMNGSNGHHNANGNKSGMSFSYDKFHPSSRN